MNSKVVTVYDDEPRAGTFLIAQGFERDHFKVLRLVEKYKERFLRLENNKRLSKSLITSKVPAKKAGRPIEEYMLNETQTIFLGTLFRNTDLVLDFKERLASDFVKAKTKLQALETHKEAPVYKMLRDAGKIVRKQTTDEMQLFIEYAKSQGSGNAERYYGNFTKMMNSLLFIAEGKYKNLREVMSIQQLMTVSSADQIINKGLNLGMKNGKFYKDIYKDIKANVILFADIHGQSEVIATQLYIE